MQVASGVLAGRRRRVREVQDEVDDKGEEQEGEERLGLVGGAFERGVGDGGEQAAVDEGPDREPEEGAAAVTLLASPLAMGGGALLEVVEGNEVHVNHHVQLAQKLIQHPYALPLCIQPPLACVLLLVLVGLLFVNVGSLVIRAVFLALGSPRRLGLIVHGAAGMCGASTS